MKRRHTGYIVLALLLAFCSQCVLYVSVTSESWVVADDPQNCYGNVSLIQYGLFHGSMVQVKRDSTLERSNLSLTCLFKLNVCAWSCQSEEYQRIEEIAALYNLSTLFSPCIANNQYNYSTEDGCLTNFSLLEIRGAFMDGTAWLITVTGMSLSGVIGLAGLFLTAYNINNIPSTYFLSIRGLYFWYAASSTMAIVILTVWGFEFLTKLSKNIGTIDTIAGRVNTSGKSYLGYSYWFQVGVLVLQLSCAALLRHRENLFDSRPVFVSSLDSRKLSNRF